MRYYAILKDGEIFSVMLATEFAAESNAEYMAGQQVDALWSYKAVAKPISQTKDAYHRPGGF